jgi:DNA-binding transcriptional MerR regulator/methylmalonyl-CoA mutase cobalamin-binding subunit
MTTNSASEPKHPIQVAARRSGLSADVIRAWERRYNAVEPQRSGTNRRLYSDEDVERLLLLGQVTRAGRRIGDVAGLPLEELKKIVEDDRRAAGKVAPPPSPRARTRPVKRHLETCLDAIDRLDAVALDAALSNASVDLSVPVLMEDLLMPLMDAIGKRWQDGVLRVAHEHLATALVRSFIGALRDVGIPPEGSPEIIIATPSGTRHEIGALMVSVLSASDGWKATYLGPDLPAEDIAAAARSRGAKAVALSIVYPADDPQLGRELRRLGKQLEEGVTLFVGGASANGYREVLDEIGAHVTVDVSILRSELQELRAAHMTA